MMLRCGHRIAFGGVVAAAFFGALFSASCGGKKDAGPGKGASGAAAGPVPVTVAEVALRDVPIYLEGLGNVTPLKTVTVKTQVDGRLDQVFFKEGQAVRRGNVLAQVDPRPFLNQLHQAQGALARDTAQLKEAELNLARYLDLVKQKLIPQQQADDQRAMVGQLEGAVALDKAQIDTAKLQVEWARITSPIDGVTGVRSVDPGNIVHASDPVGIVLITQLDPIAVLFSLSQDDLPQVMQQLAQGPMQVDAYSRGGEVQLGSGRLELVDNQVNQATATLRLKAILPNPKKLLWPNLFVKARLLLTTRKNAIVIPASALQRGPSGTFVYVVAADQTVAQRAVQVEKSVEDLELISQGLQPGEQVVVEGQNQLRPGSRVAPHKPQVAQDGKGARGPK